MLILWSNNPTYIIKPEIKDLTCGVKINSGYKIPALTKNDVLVSMGGENLKKLQAQSVLPKNRTISSLREVPHPLNGGVVFVTFDVDIKGFDHTSYVKLQTDLKLINRYVNTSSTDCVLGSYVWVKDYNHLPELINEEYNANSKPVRVALDLETVGLDPFDPNKFIVSISFSFEEGSSELIRFHGTPDQPSPDSELLDAINWMMNDDRISLVGANLKYDLLWIWLKWGIQCTNFKMDTTLVGSLLDENRCVGLDTLLLTCDLRWVTAKSVKEGDSLLGFDEHPPNKFGANRKIRKSVVLSTEVIKKPKVGITLSNGVYIEVSTNHQFLKKKSKNGGTYYWCQAKNLKVGHRLKSITDNPKHLNGSTSEYDRGRLSGFLDGDGSCHKVHETGSWALTWGQKPHIAHEDMKRIFGNLGVLYREHDDAINVCKTVSARGVWHSLHGMIALRPLRLLQKECWVGGSMPIEPEPLIITKIDNIGVGSVVAIETSTHTFIAEGLSSHNSNSLNTHTKVYTETLGGYDDSFNAEFDKSRMDLVPDKNLLPYAGGDTDATLRVANRMVQLLTQSKSQTNFYTKLLHPASMAFLDMEYTGILVDKPYMDKLEKRLIKEMEELTLQARGLLPKRILIKYEGDFALSKAAIIKDYMFSHSHGLKLKPKLLTGKTKQPSTAYNHLVMFEDVPEAKKFIDILKKWNSAKKTLSTYVMGFMKHLRADGRLHPTAILYRGDFHGSDSGSVTGRLAFREPAFNTTPKHTNWAKVLRKGYVVPEGYCMVQWDFSQGELRVMACLANVAMMIESYNNGVDLHLKTGAELNGYTLEEALQMKADKDPNIKAIRQGAKAANFGLIYDISPEGYVVFARTTYGVILTLEEAVEQHNKFFTLYPEVKDYHAAQRAYARDHGFVQSPLGRVRHLPMINSDNWGVKSKAERQAINSPTQSCLTDLTQLALAEFKRVYEYPDACKFFSMTHDAVAAYVHTSEVDFWVEAVKNIMEDLPTQDYFGWNPVLKFLVDTEVGFNMADMVELVDYPNKSPSEVLNLISN